jgi:hypothetical protein
MNEEDYNYIFHYYSLYALYSGINRIINRNNNKSYKLTYKSDIPYYGIPPEIINSMMGCILWLNKT